MADTLPTLKLTYERLCTDPDVFDSIRAHCDSPLERPGDAGRFNEANPQRQDEAAIHAGAVTKKRLDRWRTVEDEASRRDCAELFELMYNYAEFWGYPES